MAREVVWLVLSLLTVLGARSETTELTPDPTTGTTSVTSVTSGGIDLTCTINATRMECHGEQLEIPVLPFVAEKLSQAVQSGDSVAVLSLAIKSLGSLENGSLILDNVQELHIVKSDLSSVLQGAFTQAKASLHTLDLSQNNLTTVPSAALQDLPNLTTLNLSHNQIAELNVDSFKNISTLTTLSLRGNELSSVAVGTFFNLEHLKDLDLSSNKLTSFDSSAFGSTALETLRLTSNSLTSISLESSLGLVKHVDISHNQISGATMKLDLPGLITLDVGHNALTELKLDSLASLQTLTIAHNPVKWLTKASLAPLLQLETLDASHCQLQRLEGLLFSPLGKLKLLNVSANRIYTADSAAFVGLDSLKTLDLSRNAITYINQNHTADLASLEHIDLSENSIEYIFNGAFTHSPHIRSINLQGNFLDCGCELHGFANLLKHGAFAEDTLSSAVCDDGSRIVDFDFSFLACTTEGTTVADTTVPATTASELTTAKPRTTQDPTTMVPFNGRLKLVHMEQDDTKLSLTWNAYSASDPLDQLQCLVTVGVVGKNSLTNLTGPCPPAYRNKTFHIFVTELGVTYEVCLLAYRRATEVARNCSIFNTTKVVSTTPTVPERLVTTASAGGTTVVTFSEHSAETTSHEEVSMPPKDDQDDEYRYRLRFQTDLSVPRELHVNWSFTPPFRPGSPCRLNITVLENKSALTRFETACNSGGRFTVGKVVRGNDYDVCFSRLVLNIPSDCHEISFPKLAYSHGPAAGASSSAAGGREESRPPVALLIMIAALALIAVLAVVLFIHRRLRKRAVARRKVKESVFHLQINRRSGTYQVQDATEARTTLSSSVSHDGTTKMSQRASSVDEL